MDPFNYPMPSVMTGTLLFEPVVNLFAVHSDQVLLFTDDSKVAFV